MPDQAPMMTVSAKEMYDVVQRVELAAQSLATSVTVIKDIVQDHEQRLRIVEQAGDVSRRQDLLEQRVNSHEIAFTKQGERIGAIEARLASRVSPIAIASVVAAFTSIVVAALFGVAAL